MSHLLDRDKDTRAQCHVHIETHSHSIYVCFKCVITHAHRHICTHTHTTHTHTHTTCTHAHTHTTHTSWMVLIQSIKSSSVSALNRYPRLCVFSSKQWQCRGSWDFEKSSSHLATLNISSGLISPSSSESWEGRRQEKG